MLMCVDAPEEPLSFSNTSPSPWLTSWLRNPFTCTQLALPFLRKHQRVRKQQRRQGPLIQPGIPLQYVAVTRRPSRINRDLL
jgi:hypothetical protein